MRIRLTPIFIAVGLLVFAETAIAAVEGTPMTAPKVVSEAGVSYVSGGVGEDEFRVIESMAKQFNLKLLMTTKEGNYLSNVTIAIADRHGKKVLDTVSEGPVLFASLPPGKYQVTASMGGETQQQRVEVGRGQRELRFFWQD